MTPRPHAAAGLLNMIAFVRRSVTVQKTAPALSGWSVARAVLYRYRRQLGPIWILLVLVVAALVVSHQDPLRVFGVAAFGALLVVAALHRRLHKRRERVYTGVCLTGAVLGLTLLSLVGLGSRVLNTVCVLGWFAASVRWWWRHRGRNSRSDWGVSPTERTYIDRWNASIRDGSGKIKGAQLVQEPPFEYGLSFRVKAVPGEQYLGIFQAELPRLSSGLQTPLRDLLIEQHPNTEDPTVLRLRVVTKSPIKKPVLYTGPKLTNGRIVLGPYADGVGAATWRMFTDNSIYGGFVLGGLGAGKSRLLELIALGARQMGAIVLYLDGQNGASSPMLWKYSDWRGGPAEAEMILAALERGMLKRQVYNRVNNLDGFTLGEGLTPILTIADECHSIFQKATAERWAVRSREDRKLGAALIAGNQRSGIDAFGDVEVLRSTMMDGNIVALRTSSKSSAQILPGLDVNPAIFPRDLPGYGYYVATDEGDRTAPFRTEWIPSDKDKDKDRTICVPSVHEWFERIPGGELDEMTAEAFGSDYLDRHRLAAERDAADRAFILGSGRLALTDGEESSDAARATMRDAILVLPWDRGPLTFREVWNALEDAGVRVNESTLTVALRGLKQDGVLAQDGPKRPYRYVGARREGNS